MEYIAKGKTFTGESSEGDIQIAYAMAVEQAMSGLRSSLVLWEIVIISGESGGIVEKNSVSVQIHAHKPAR